jgi:hypothetical protein
MRPHAHRVTAAIALVAATLCFGAGAPSKGALAAENPNAALPVERVEVRLEEQDFAFDYRAYPEPMALDLDQASGGQDTPYDTLLSFYNVLASIETYDEIVPYGRLANGEIDPPPADIPRFIEAAHTVLTGGEVLIFGEILYREYTIYVYRLTKSIKRHLGLPIRKFGDRYFVVKDLVLADDLAKRLSALRWNVDELKAKHPPRAEE